MLSSSVNSLEGNESSVDNDDEEYIKVNEVDSPDDTPNIVETPRSKLNFGPMSSKSSSTSKHKNIGSVDSVVEEVTQQNGDHQEKLLEMQKNAYSINNQRRTGREKQTQTRKKKLT